jgi:uncharacterized protein YrrD
LHRQLDERTELLPLPNGPSERKNKMDIPVNAKVKCQNKVCGKISCVIINPISKLVTHIVVQEKGFIGIERLIPVEEILESQSDQITLRCSPDALSQFEYFTESHYISSDVQFPDHEVEHYHYFPFSTSEFGDTFENGPWFVETECVPQGELGIHNGAEIFATDGKVGQVDEFLISPKDDRISHLVLREGHLWGQKLVTIPVSEIDRMEPDLVYLKLSKRDIENLPVIPVKRHFPLTTP